MRDDRPPARRKRPPRRQVLAARAAREIRWLALSEGLAYCARLQRLGDPRLEGELEHWLECAQVSALLSTAEAERLRSASADPGFPLLARASVERARRQLHVQARRAHRRNGSWIHVAAHRCLLSVPAPTGRTGRRLLFIAAATGAASAVGVVAARGDALPVPTGLDPARQRVTDPSPRCPIPPHLRRAFVTAAERTDLPLPLLVAVARSESRFDGAAHSSAGALGVLQLMPETARALGADPRDPYENVLAGARYLRSLVGRFGSTKLALAAYNVGPTALAARHGALDRATRAYVANVTRVWRSVRRCR